HPLLTHCHHHSARNHPTPLSSPTRRSSDLVRDDEIIASSGDISAKVNVRSARKSLISALYGIAVEEGRINLDSTLAERAIDDSQDRKSTRLNSSHVKNSYAVFCLKINTKND